MYFKELVTLLLVLGNFPINAEDSKEVYKDYIEEVPENLPNPDYHENQKHFEQNEKWQAKNNGVDYDPKYQFKKDYKRWDDKKHEKHNSFDSREKTKYMKINEIDSDEYIEKFNKNGKIFNQNHIYDKANKRNPEKLMLDDNGNHAEKERPRTLIDDINVNYINNVKKISTDSEFVTEKFNNKYKSKENYEENYQNNKFYMKREKKDFYQTLKAIDLSNPPSPNDTVTMARYIVHAVDWAAVGTISGRAPTKNAPFVCVKATSDGVANMSSGVPFFYMSPMDLCTQDILKDNRASVLVTLSETEYCKKKELDPQDPRCAKLTLSGKIKRVKPGSPEEKFAKDALFSKHPAMTTWPAGHNWFVSKLKIGQIILLDQFGGATYIKVKDYLNGGVIEPEL